MQDATLAHVRTTSAVVGWPQLERLGRWKDVVASTPWRVGTPVTPESIFVHTHFVEYLNCSACLFEGATRASSLALPDPRHVTKLTIILDGNHVCCKQTLTHLGTRVRTLTHSHACTHTRTRTQSIAHPHIRTRAHAHTRTRAHTQVDLYLYDDDEKRELAIALCAQYDMGLVPTGLLNAQPSFTCEMAVQEAVRAAHLYTTAPVRQCASADECSLPGGENVGGSSGGSGGGEGSGESQSLLKGRLRAKPSSSHAPSLPWTRHNRSEFVLSVIGETPAPDSNSDSTSDSKQEVHLLGGMNRALLESYFCAGGNRNDVESVAASVLDSAIGRVIGSMGLQNAVTNHVVLFDIVDTWKPGLDHYMERFYEFCKESGFEPCDAQVARAVAEQVHLTINGTFQSRMVTCWNWWWSCG